MKKEITGNEIKQLRTFTGVLLALVVVLTTVRYIIRGYPEGVPVGLVLACIAAVIFIIALAAPRPLIPAFRIWMIIAHAIGWCMTRLLLTSMFYLVFTPIGIIMRLVGRDPLHRDFRSSKTSFWIAKEAPREGLERYTRQF
ncbi:MAG: hypothetical protein JW941_03250 [Candidatus Coatesbacteria bacterium]|nr:hypothetical protein [Candidatus Coatesbacteria bacterium]